MVKKTQRLVALTILGVTISSSILSSASVTQVLADNSIEYINIRRDLTEAETLLVDQFVSTKDNRFVLHVNSTLSEEVEFLAKKQIADTNLKISRAEIKESIFADTQNKTIGTIDLLYRFPGKNAIEFQ